jgi:hypothetical protein
MEELVCIDLAEKSRSRETPVTIIVIMIDTIKVIRNRTFISFLLSF